MLIQKEIRKQPSTPGKVRISFGKFSGKYVHEAPPWWRNWVLKNIDSDTEDPKFRPVLDEIIRLKIK